LRTPKPKSATHAPVQAPAPAHILGIDPGLGGALALLNVSTRAIESLHDMPVIQGRVDPARLALIVGMCQLQGTIVAVVELVRSMPRQSGSFNFGVSAGVVHGVLGALGVPMVLIPPGVWKPAMGLRRGLNETQAQNKTRARELAQKLWPLQAGMFKLIKNHDRAEAALLARFFCTKQDWV
jgi:crossover junction endodeoxyribonuclease RuvC